MLRSRAKSCALEMIRSRSFSSVAGITGAAYQNMGIDKPLFDKLLVANRGEIALRVFKTCKKMGIKTVAVYSEVDAKSNFVEAADEAICIGPAPSRESYLNIDAILGAIKETGADAVHPGYGFLSENAGFVEKIENMNGVEFIGPKSSAMRMLGEKLSAKAVASKAGVHVVPGGVEITSDEQLLSVAKSIGYPVMVKASSGGGGKGMRVAWNDQELFEGFRLSKQEAKSSFATDKVFVEKFIEDPRHIEIQIMGDKYGNAIYLNERECSIQRRNQKVVEEAPSVVLSAFPEIRQQMGTQAVNLAKEVGYHCAGTCEFLMDKNRNFYFLEMNTRLQVEHPITEEITGLDLVELMLRVSSGEKLSLLQKDVKIDGWAFESRVYAEDPLNNFLPSIGRLTRYQPPSGEHIRVDGGVSEGSDISIYYDPMISKLITKGPDRQTALEYANKALDSYVIRGVRHNINFIRSLYANPDFIKGDISTKFIESHYPDGYKGHSLSATDKIILFGTAALHHITETRRAESISGKFASYKPKDLTHLIISNGKEEKELRVISEKNGQLEFEMDSTLHTISSSWKPGDLLIESVLDGEENILQVCEKIPYGVTLIYFGSEYPLKVMTPAEKKLMDLMPPPVTLDSSKFIISPMPGAVFSIKVKEGDVVGSGEEICVVEAMKMQNILRAPSGGKVKKILVKAGDTVSAEEILVEFE